MPLTTSHIVSLVREGLEKDECKRSYIGFNNFPFGSCRDASIILGQMLNKYCNCSFDLVATERELPFKSHSFLENKDIIIDITIDQFGPERTSFIIEKPKAEYPSNEYFETLRRPVGNEDISQFITAYSFVDKFIQAKLIA